MNKKFAPELPVKDSNTSVNRAEINAVIRDFTEIFSREKPPYLEYSNPRIDNILKKHMVSKAEVFRSLQNNPRFTSDSQRIYKTNKYDIKNSNELQELLKVRREGIEENQELYEHYQSCRNDINNMKKKGVLRVIENKNEKRTLLFMKDEKYDIKDFQDVAEKLKRKWEEVIDKEYTIKTQEIEIKNKGGKNLKKRARKSRGKVIYNTWMKSILDFREMTNGN